MKRKVDWDEEEPRIKDVLNTLSQAVSRKRASELLHNMAASKDILLWTPRWQLLRHQWIIPVTNTPELVEYVLLTQNDDVAKLHALNTFPEGLAELSLRDRRSKGKGEGEFAPRARTFFSQTCCNHPSTDCDTVARHRCRCAFSSTF